MKKINFKKIILYEDDDLMVINKPPFISTLEDRAAPHYNIHLFATNYYEKAQLCHRLDKETSGILLIAKHAEAYRHLCKQFAQRTIQKIYHAIVHTIQKFDNIVINAPIYTSKKGISYIDHQRGKAATTIFQTKEAFLYYTLVVCQPVTGRMHQIRLHAAYQKAPIVGDIQYGGRPVYLSTIKKNYLLKKNTVEGPLTKRAMLHAYSLKFQNLQKKEVMIQAPYTKDFNTLLRQLRLNQLGFYEG